MEPTGRLSIPTPRLLNPASIAQWELSFSSFGPQKLAQSASAPKIGLAGSRSPDVNRFVCTRTGLIGRAAPLAPFRRGIPKQHLHKIWGGQERFEDWRDKPNYGKRPPYLRRIQRQHLATTPALDATSVADLTIQGDGSSPPSNSSPRSASPIGLRASQSRGFVSSHYMPLRTNDHPAFRPTTPACCTYGIRVDFVQFGSSSRLPSGGTMRVQANLPHHPGSKAFPGRLSPLLPSRPVTLARPGTVLSRSGTVAEQIGWGLEY